MDASQPPEYEHLGGWRPDLRNLQAIRRVDPEGYQQIMQARRNVQAKRDAARVNAFYAIDDIFSNNTLMNYLDDEVIGQLYVANSVREIRPDLMVSDLKRLLREAMTKAETDFQALNQEESQWIRELIEAESLGKKSGDKEYDDIGGEIDKVRQAKDVFRDKARRLDAFIQALDAASLDDRPLKDFVASVHDNVEYMNEKKADREEGRRGF